MFLKKYNALIWRVVAHTEKLGWFIRYLLIHKAKQFCYFLIVQAEDNQIVSE